MSPASQIYAKITGPIVMVGFGSIGKGTLPLIERHFEFDKSRFVIIDPHEDGELARQHEKAVLWVATLSGISIALSYRSRLSGSSDSLNVRIMSTISDQDAEERHKALQALEYLREAKVNLLERVRYGAPAGDIESAMEEFEEAWSVTERLVKQLIAPSKP